MLRGEQPELILFLSRINFFTHIDGNFPLIRGQNGFHGLQNNISAAVWPSVETLSVSLSKDYIMSVAEKKKGARFAGLSNLKVLEEKKQNQLPKDPLTQQENSLPFPVQADRSLRSFGRISLTQRSRTFLPEELLSNTEASVENISILRVREAR